MLRLEYAYWMIGALLLHAGLRNLQQRRHYHAAFWMLLGLLFCGGNYVLAQQAKGQPLPAQCAGAGVILLALLAPHLRRHPQHEEGTASHRASSSLRLGHKLFVPALMIPLVTLLIALFGAHLSVYGQPLLQRSQITLIGMALACVIALFAALRLTRARFADGLIESRRLLDAIGWAVLLPLLLAALGEVFTRSGVGSAISALASAALPPDNAVACLFAFALGMLLFTVIMGNAFAAFPVMMAGIGLPLLVLRYHSNPAMLGAMGMLCGYCGTLLTPMAADFNLVPAALLELRNPYAVIRAQAWSALWIFVGTFALMCILIWR